MKKIILLLIVNILSLLIVQGNNNEPVTMGVSRINITPEEPVLMSGYEARKTPNTGIHDELFATALCFSKANSKVMIITTDVIGFSHKQADEIKQSINLKTGISLDNILITATHNHGAPVIKTYTKKVPAENERYIITLIEKLVKISDEASRNLQPVKIGIGKGKCTMNINRRAKFADGGIWLGRNPDGPCDHEVDILKFENMDGKLIAMHINWPCHGTTGGQKNYEITGDWPGATARYLENELGNETIIAVTAGASGDINPIYGPGNNFDEINAIGSILGAEVIKILPDIETLPAYTINSLYKTISLPGKKGSDTHFPQDEYEKGPDVEIRLSAIKVGNIVFTGISGEVMTEIGIKLKEKSPYSGTVIITHCNGSSGYICTDDAFNEGGYEIKVTKLMPGAEQTIINNLTEMINLL